MFDPIHLIIMVGAMLLSKGAAMMLQRKFVQYSRVPMPLSGKEVAEKMLSDSGISDVQVISVRGQLTDHYHPGKKTVNLSEVVYNQRNFAAAAVAAHECGHAIQHAKAYAALKMRSSLVPMVGVSSKFSNILIMAGFIIFSLSQGGAIGLPSAVGLWALGAGIVLFSFSTLFSMVTLPVEFDASRRALVWMKSSGFSTAEGQAAAKDALKWAAMTYVVAALTSLAQLLNFIRLFLQMRR